MDVFIYKAALVCAACAASAINRLEMFAENVDTGDSGDWPQGPHADGGGEADAPQHCDDCHVFLENPLTADGLRFAQETVDEFRALAAETRHTWCEFYGLSRRFKWTVEFTVDQTWVEDGFDLTDERALSMLAHDLSSAYGHEIDARVIEAPDQADIRLTQGYPAEAE
jgi:hypothetical protein